MPSTVAFPIRVRTDCRVLGESRQLVLDACGAALSRALANCARSVPPGARDVRMPGISTEIHWSGAGLPDIAIDQREALEAELTALIETLARDSALDVGLPNLADRGDPSESADGARLDRLLGLYTLPSYQGGADVTVPANTQITFEAQTVYAHTSVEWLPVASMTELVQAFREQFLDHYPEPPRSGLTGAIYRDAQHGMSVTLWQLTDGSLKGTVRLSGISSPRVDVTGSSLVTRPMELPPGASYRMRFIAPATADNRVSVLTQVYERQLTELFRRNGHFPHDTMSQAEFEPQLLARVQTAIQALARMIPEHVVCFVALEVNGEAGLLYSAIPISEDLDVELLPLTQEVAHRRRGRQAGAGRGGRDGGTGTGSGTGVQRGAGAGGGGGEGGNLHDGRSGFVDAPGAASDEGSPFPGEPAENGGSGTSIGGTGICEPFLGEPSTDQLDAAGRLLSDRMQRIAGQLEIQPCKYVGHFLIAAASTLGALARRVGVADINETGTTTVASGEGSLGSLDFHPGASVQLQLLRHLAGVVPAITELSGSLQDVMAENGKLIAGDYEGAAGSWMLQFVEELHGILDEAVGDLFKMTCRVVLLQLLNTSRAAIDARRLEPGFSAFAGLFERIVVPQLADIDELMHLRDRLQGAQAAAAYASANQRMVNAYFAGVPGAPGASTTQGSPPGQPRPGSWQEARAGVTRALTPTHHLAEGPAAPNAYETIEQGGVMRIRDRRGDLWTLEAIEQAIVLRRGTIENVEPLVKQLTDLPETMERFRNPAGGVRAELQSVLDEMSYNNWDITTSAREDPDYAFGTRVPHGGTETVPGTGYELQGIHLLAHREIAEFFRGDPFYARGLDRILGAAETAHTFTVVAEFVGIVLLAVVCPEAAVYAGVALAAYHYDEAREHERLYGALIDPEQVISYAEVEAELFGAELGLALSLLPVAGELLGEARAAFRVIAGEAAEVSEAAARAAAEQAATGLIRTAEHGFVEKFVIEATKAYAIQKVFEQVLAPIMESLEREWGTTGPIGGLDRAMAQLAQRAHERSAATGGGEPQR
jgi:hypothetical protein